jgi:hypothetical protein
MTDRQTDRQTEPQLRMEGQARRHHANRETRPNLCDTIKRIPNRMHLLRCSFVFLFVI